MILSLHSSSISEILEQSPQGLISSVIYEILYSQGHARAVHPQEKNFCCHLCGFKTYANSVLKVHIESKHENKKRFFCSECEASFYYKVKYQEHLSRAHTGKVIIEKSRGEVSQLEQDTIENVS